MTERKRTFEVVRRDDNEKGIDQTAHMTGQERLELLEVIRREVAKVTNSEYPERVRRVFEVARR